MGYKVIYGDFKSLISLNVNECTLYLLKQKKKKEKNKKKKQNQLLANLVRTVHVKQPTKSEKLFSAALVLHVGGTVCYM